MEALFMGRRGHNVNFNDPNEEDRPICSDGVYYQLLRAIGAIAGINLPEIQVPCGEQQH
jgi:hypothetical protein